MDDSHSSNGSVEVRELCCPLCATSVRVQLPLRVRIVERDDDFCPRTLGRNPVLAAIHRCPGCGYCGVTAEFAPIAEPRTATKLHRVLVPIAAEQLRTIRQRYECRARLDVSLGEPSQRIGDAYLKAAWSARITGEPAEHEQANLRKAAQYFALALRARSVATSRVPVLCYLLGALHRRLGERDETYRWLAKLDESSAQEASPQWLSNWRDRLAARLRAESDDSDS